MQFEEVNRETVENLLLKMQEEIMNKSWDDEEDNTDDPSGAYEEGIESAIKTIRGHFGLKEYSFSGKAWWEQPSKEIYRRVMWETDLSRVYG